METRYYEQIFEDFKNNHPYLLNDVNDFRPRGEMGIRVIMRDGSLYDYDNITRGVRRVQSFDASDIENITDEYCRSAFSYNLTEQMSLKGYTQRTLADDTGLSKGTIHNYINKKATPTATALRRIAKVLNCTIDELLN